MDIGKYAKYAGKAVLEFYRANPARRIPATLGVAAGAALGDSAAERMAYAAGLGAVGYFGKDLLKYARRHPWEAALTAGGLFAGYEVGSFFDVNTRGAFIPLGWADTAGLVTGGIIGNRVGSGIDRKNRGNRPRIRMIH